MTALKDMTVESKGTSPEALAKFASAARVKGGEVKRTGVAATTETKAIPTDPDLQHEAATAVLREGGNWRGRKFSITNSRASRSNCGSS